MDVADIGQHRAHPLGIWSGCFRCFLRASSSFPRKGQPRWYLTIVIDRSGSMDTALVDGTDGPKRTRWQEAVEQLLHRGDEADLVLGAHFDLEGFAQRAESLAAGIEDQDRLDHGRIVAGTDK